MSIKDFKFIKPEIPSIYQTLWLPEDNHTPIGGGTTSAIDNNNGGSMKFKIGDEVEAIPGQQIQPGLHYIAPGKHAVSHIPNDATVHLDGDNQRSYHISRLELCAKSDLENLVERANEAILVLHEAWTRRNELESYSLGNNGRPIGWDNGGKLDILYAMGQIDCGYSARNIKIRVKKELKKITPYRTVWCSHDVSGDSENVKVGCKKFTTKEAKSLLEEFIDRKASKYIIGGTHYDANVDGIKTGSDIIYWEDARTLLNKIREVLTK